MTMFKGLCGLAFAAAPVALCAQPVRPGEAIIVTATREPVALARLPYSVTTVSREDLASSESLADALTGLPEAYVQMPGGRTGFAALFLRGADPNFTTVLLEGVPLDSPTNSRGGAVNLAAIPSAAIDHAELVAGPASTLYGSGPLAGALNLLVAPPAERHQATLGGTAGTLGELSAFGRWQGPLARGIGGSLSAVIDDAGDGVPGSAFRSQTLTLRLAPVDGGRGSLLVHLAGTKGRGYPDASGGQDLAVIRETEQRESDETILAGDLPLARAGAVAFTLSGSYRTRGDHVVSPGVAPSDTSPTGVPAGQDDIRYRHWIARQDMRIDLGDAIATLGVQGQWESARSTGYLDFGFPVPTDFDATRTTLSAFGELSGGSEALEANGSLRLDRIEGIGTRLTGRGGLRYFLGSTLSVRAAAGSAFKAPSFYALGNPFVGNTDLKPESATSVELGFDWRPDPANHVAVTLFRSHYRDLIDFVPADPPRLENRARVRGQGIALDLAGRLGRALGATAGVQYVETIDLETGQQLLNRPRWRASAALAWTPSAALGLTARYNFTGPRDDYAIPVGVAKLGRSHQVSASLSLALGKMTRLLIDFDDLLDDQAQDTLGFRAPGRRARVTISHKFM